MNEIAPKYHGVPEHDHWLKDHKAEWMAQHPRREKWCVSVLEALCDDSTLSDACFSAHISLTKFYSKIHNDPEFYDAYNLAIEEGIVEYKEDLPAECEVV